MNNYDLNINSEMNKHIHLRLNASLVDYIFLDMHFLGQLQTIKGFFHDFKNFPSQQKSYKFLCKMHENFKNLM